MTRNFIEKHLIFRGELGVFKVIKTKKGNIYLNQNRNTERQNTNKVVQIVAKIIPVIRECRE